MKRNDIILINGRFAILTDEIEDWVFVREYGDDPGQYSKHSNEVTIPTIEEKIDFLVRKLIEES